MQRFLQTQRNSSTTFDFTGVFERSPPFLLPVTDECKRIN